MRFILAIAAVAALRSSSCDAFLNLPFVAPGNPAVAKYAEAQESALLKIHLDIGQMEEKGGKPIITGNRLGIDGMMVELHGKEEADYKHPSLPGANGPHPQLSSGPMALDLLEQGKFVDLSGSRRVAMDNGAWEMVWRDGVKRGALICGFDVPEEVKRNDALIPKGRLYMTFPVWTEESLQELRERKEKAEEKVAKAMDRLRDAKAKMATDTNPLMRAWHFREVCNAHEDIEYSGFRTYKNMHLDRDMIHLKDGLHLCTLGTVWTKKDGFLGADHVLLGSATAVRGDRGEMEEKKTVHKRELKDVAYDGLRPFEWQLAP